MLIGIKSRKGGGKDTAANFLCEKHNFVRYGFADPLKKGIREMFGFNDDQLWGETKEVIDEFWNVSPREVLQYAGTELFQFELPRLMPALKDKIGRGFWVKRFEKWYQENSDLNIVISDLRFLHEAAKIKELGGVVLELKRNTNLNEFSNHASEVELEQIIPDWVIDNNDTLENLYIHLDDFLLQQHI
jgi:hypothetical protein